MKNLIKMIAVATVLFSTVACTGELMSDEQRARIASMRAAHSGSNSSGGSATQHQVDAGKNGILADTEEETQEGGTTTEGFPAPPAVGGMY